MKQGQVMIEMMLALAVLVLVALAAVQLTIKSVSNAGYSRRQSMASGHATAAVEWVRGQRDSLGWNQFSGYVGLFCLNTLAWTPGACASGSTIPGSVFTRQINITGSGNRNIEVNVTWDNGGKIASVKQTLQLTQH